MATFVELLSSAVTADCSINICTARVEMLVLQRKGFYGQNIGSDLVSLDLVAVSSWI